MKLKLALIGTGSIARYHVYPDGDPNKPLFPDGEAEYVAVMDIDGARAKAFAEQYRIPRYYTDYDALLTAETPDIVCIATPPHLHTPQSIQAMEHGAWVLCEKPLCASLREFDALTATERRTGTFCSSIFQYRFGGGNRHLKQIVDAKVAGDVLVGTCHTTWFRDAAYYAVAWRGTWKNELGGPTMGHGIHAMDTFLWTMGDWEEVCALCGCLDRDLEVEDTSTASVRFASGAIGNILNSALCPQQRTFVRYDFQHGSAWTS